MTKKLNLKIVTMILVLIQLVTSVDTSAWAYSKSVMPPSGESWNLGKISIPEDLGRVELLPTPKKKVYKQLILIQDAHAVPSAQHAIYEILRHLRSAVGLKTVLLEGLTAKPDLSLLQSFPDRDWFIQFLKKDIEAQNIGAGAAALIAETSFNTLPAEESQNYYRAVRAYQYGIDFQPKILTNINRAQNHLQEQKNKIYSKTLLAWDALLHQEDFAGIQTLMRGQWQLAEEVWERYPQLKQLRDIGRILRFSEKPVFKKFWMQALRGFSHSKLNLTRDARLEWESITRDYEAGRVSALDAAIKIEAWHQKWNLSAQNNLSSLSFRAYSLLLRHAHQLNSLKAGFLADEYQTFLDERVRIYLNTNEQKQLHARTIKLLLLKKLTEMKLTAKEWQRFKAQVPNHPIWKSYADFYTVQKSRDEAMLRQMNQAFKTRSAVALITGGFHSSALVTAAQARGWSVAVVTPSIQSLSSADRYAELMRGDVAWRTEMKSENGMIDLQKAYLNYAIKKYAQEKPGQLYDVLLQWRKNLILRLADEKKLDRAVAAAGPIHRWLVEFMPEDQKQTLRAEWIQKIQDHFKAHSPVQTQVQQSLTSIPVFSPFGSVPENLVRPKTPMVTQASGRGAKEVRSEMRPEQPDDQRLTPNAESWANKEKKRLVLNGERSADLSRSEMRKGKEELITRLVKEWPGMIQRGKESEITFDVSGTLRWNGPLSDEMAEALAWLLTEGIKISLISGIAPDTLKKQILLPVFEKLKAQHENPADFYSKITVYSGAGALKLTLDRDGKFVVDKAYTKKNRIPDNVAKVVRETVNEFFNSSDIKRALKKGGQSLIPDPRRRPGKFTVHQGGPAIHDANAFWRKAAKGGVAVPAVLETKDAEGKPVHFLLTFAPDIEGLKIKKSLKKYIVKKLEAAGYKNAIGFIEANESAMHMVAAHVNKVTAGKDVARRTPNPYYIADDFGATKLGKKRADEAIAGIPEFVRRTVSVTMKPKRLKQSKVAYHIGGGPEGVASLILTLRDQTRATRRNRSETRNSSRPIPDPGSGIGPNSRFSRSEMRKKDSVSGKKRASSGGAKKIHHAAQKAPLEERIRILLKEVWSIFNTHQNWQRAIVAFGSARIPPGHRYYAAAEKLGAYLVEKNLAGRTGAGPSIMEAVLKGMMNAMMELLSRINQAAVGAQVTMGVQHMAQRQGIRISLPFEQETNGFVEVVKNYIHFVTRKKALYENSYGAIAFPGGYGTMDEIFEVLTRGVPLVLYGQDFWNPILEAFRESFKGENFDDVFKGVLVTDDVEESIQFLLKSSQQVGSKPFHMTRENVLKSNREMAREMRRLRQMPRAVTFVGEPQSASATLPVSSGLSAYLQSLGVSVRVANQELLTHLTADKPKGEARNKLQAVLLSYPESEKSAPNYPIPKSRLITLAEQSSHQFLVTGNSYAYVFFPGEGKTMNILFDTLQILQIEYQLQKHPKVKRKPIILIGKKFWQPIKDALTSQMLDGADGLKTISSEDPSLLIVVNSVAEAMEEIQKFLPKTVQAQVLKDFKNRELMGVSAGVLEARSEARAALHKRTVSEQADSLRRLTLKSLPNVPFYELDEEMANQDVTRFFDAIRQAREMENYFDRTFSLGMRENIKGARSAYYSLKKGKLMLEMVSLPLLPGNVYELTVFKLINVKDESDKGTPVGYAIHTIYKDKNGKKIKVIRAAFNVFKDYREKISKQYSFKAHDLYNAWLASLVSRNPKEIRVDVKSQITESRLGDLYLRVLFNLSRGYYPPDNKEEADQLYLDMQNGKNVTHERIDAFLKKTKAEYWILPVQDLKQRAVERRSEIRYGGQVREANSENGALRNVRRELFIGMAVISAVISKIISIFSPTSFSEAWFWTAIVLGVYNFAVFFMQSRLSAKSLNEDSAEMKSSPETKLRQQVFFKKYQSAIEFPPEVRDVYLQIFPKPLRDELGIGDAIKVVSGFSSNIVELTQGVDGDVAMLTLEVVITHPQGAIQRQMEITLHAKGDVLTIDNGFLPKFKAATDMYGDYYSSSLHYWLKFHLLPAAIQMGFKEVEFKNAKESSKQVLSALGFIENISGSLWKKSLNSSDARSDKARPSKDSVDKKNRSEVRVHQFQDLGLSVSAGRMDLVVLAEAVRKRRVRNEKDFVLIPKKTQLMIPDRALTGMHDGKKIAIAPAYVTAKGTISVMQEYVSVSLATIDGTFRVGVNGTTSHRLYITDSKAQLAVARYGANNIALSRSDTFNGERMASMQVVPKEHTHYLQVSAGSDSAGYALRVRDISGLTRRDVYGRSELRSAGEALGLKLRQEGKQVGATETLEKTYESAVYAYPTLSQDPGLPRSVAEVLRSILYQPNEKTINPGSDFAHKGVEWENKSFFLRLIFDQDQNLIGVFPVNDVSHSYIELTHYALPWPIHINETSIRAPFMQKRLADASFLSRFANGFDLEKYQAQFAPYAQIDFNQSAPGYKAFNWFPHVRDMRKLKNNEVHMVVPVYPTVYSPANYLHAYLDHSYHENLFRQANPEDDVLILGAGSGVDTRIVSLKTNKPIDLGDINPMAVLNAQTTAQMAQISVRAAQANALRTMSGEPLFGDKQYDLIAWNMPDYSSRAQRGIKQVDDRWDGDYQGEVLQQFIDDLPARVKPGGRVLVWNNYHSNVLRMLTHGGRRRDPNWPFTVEQIGGSKSYVYLLTRSPRSEMRVLTHDEAARLTPKYETAAEFYDRYADWRRANPDKKLLTLVRHVEATSNLFDTVQSSLTFSPPTLVRGAGQRKALTQFFLSRRIPFQKIISSKLERANFTVSKIARERGLSVETWKRLNELMLHPVGGMTRKYIADLHVTLVDQFNINPDAFETPIFSWKKQAGNLRKLFDEVEAAKESDILVGTHGLTLRGIFEILLQIPTTKDRLVMEKIGRAPNVGISTLAFDPETRQWELLVLQDNSYLPESLAGERSRGELWIEKIGFYVRAIKRVLFRAFGYEGPELIDYQPFVPPFILPTALQISVVQSAYRRTAEILSRASRRSEMRTGQLEKDLAPLVSALGSPQTLAQIQAKTHTEFELVSNIGSYSLVFRFKNKYPNLVFKLMRPEAAQKEDTDHFKIQQQVLGQIYRALFLEHAGVTTVDGVDLKYIRTYEGKLALAPYQFMEVGSEMIAIQQKAEPLTNAESQLNVVYENLNSLSLRTGDLSEKNTGTIDGEPVLFDFGRFGPDENFDALYRSEMRHSVLGTFYALRGALFDFFAKALGQPNTGHGEVTDSVMGGNFFKRYYLPIGKPHGYELLWALGKIHVMNLYKLIQEFSRVVRVPKLSFFFFGFKFRDSAFFIFFHKLFLAVIEPLFGFGHIARRDDANGAVSQVFNNDKEIASRIGLPVDQISSVPATINPRLIFASFLGLIGMNLMPSNMLNVFFIPFKIANPHSLLSSEVYLYIQKMSSLGFLSSASFLGILAICLIFINNNIILNKNLDYAETALSLRSVRGRSELRKQNSGTAFSVQRSETSRQSAGVSRRSKTGRSEMRNKEPTNVQRLTTDANEASLRSRHGRSEIRSWLGELSRLALWFAPFVGTPVVAPDESVSVNAEQWLKAGKGEMLLHDDKGKAYRIVYESSAVNQDDRRQFHRLRVFIGSNTTRPIAHLDFMTANDYSEMKVAFDETLSEEIVGEYAIWVDDRYAKRGIGRSLLGMALRLSKERGAGLFIVQNVLVRDYYDHVGFHPVHEGLSTYLFDLSRPESEFPKIKIISRKRSEMREQKDGTAHSVPRTTKYDLRSTMSHPEGRSEMRKPVQTTDYRPKTIDFGRSRWSSVVGLRSGHGRSEIRKPNNSTVYIVHSTADDDLENTIPRSSGRHALTSLARLLGLQRNYEPGVLSGGTEEELSALLEKNFSALVEMEVARQSDVLVDAAMQLQRSKPQLEKAWEESLSRLQAAIRTGQIQKTAPVIFYSREIEAQLIEFITLTQKSFELANPMESTKRYQFSVVFRTDYELKAFEKKHGKLKQVETYGPHAMGQLATDVFNEKKWQNHYGVFGARELVADIGGMEWQRNLSAEGLSDEISFALVPDAMSYFARTATQDINETTLSRALANWFSHLRFQRGVGITILETFISAFSTGFKAVSTSV